jgi:hypothetical protein
VMNTLQGELLFIFCSEGREWTYTHHHHIVHKQEWKHEQLQTAMGVRRLLWKASDTLKRNMAPYKQYKE